MHLCQAVSAQEESSKIWDTMKAFSKPHTVSTKSVIPESLGGVCMPKATPSQKQLEKIQVTTSFVAECEKSCINSELYSSLQGMHPTPPHNG